MKFALWILLVFMAGAVTVSFASAAELDENCIAVVYTAEGFRGTSWRIYKTGKYDLWQGFNLPNDSISSIRVRPGYSVTIYEHIDFEGGSTTVRQDASALGRKWKRQASSLEVKRLEESVTKDEARTWLEEIESDTAGFLHRRDEEALKTYINSYEPHWYGGSSDASRVERGGDLLALFGDLGYDVSEWMPNTFAQQMNNFFDWRKDLSVWRVACLVLNVDPESYEKLSPR
jgi:hypothetical protein